MICKIDQRYDKVTSRESRAAHLGMQVCDGECEG